MVLSLKRRLFDARLSVLVADRGFFDFSVRRGLEHDKKDLQTIKG